MPSAAWGITRRSVCTDRPATASRGENRMAIAKPSLPWPCFSVRRGEREEVRGERARLEKKKSAARRPGVSGSEKSSVS